MIKAVLVFNNHGKPRLIKFYEYYSMNHDGPNDMKGMIKLLKWENEDIIDFDGCKLYFSEDQQQVIIRETFQLVSKRDDVVCNFLEGGSLIGGDDYKIIYRHYATLYFIFCVDSSESELGILDLVQVFVEALDKSFENVCELDLIFHVDKVHQVLNEMVLGGMVLETHMSEIISRYDEQNKLEKQEAGMIAAPARAMSVMKDMNLPQKFRDLKLPDIPSLQGKFQL